MIAVDAMGGDRAPNAIVQGAIAAAQSGISVLLCGDRERIRLLLQEHCSDWAQLPIEIEHAPENISMEDEPTKAVKRKQQSSLVVAMKAVSSGRCTAFVSAGNSGAVLVASIFYSGRMRHVLRPAVGSFLPTRTGAIFCLDLGANVDCRASFLHQFALMGHAYMQVVSDMASPRIALLSNGHEPYKGSAEIKKAYDYLAGAPINFVGNLESRELFDDRADVLVCDGFAGNVMLKTVQGTAAALFNWIKDAAQSASWVERMMLGGSKSIFDKVKNKTDYASQGGALLLGVNHPVILAHGRSDARACANAIKFAQRVVDEQHVGKFKALLEPLLQSQVSFAKTVSQRVRSIFHWGQS